MKPGLLIAALLLFLAACNKDKIDELPAEISKLQPIKNLADTREQVLAENGNLILKNPVLFADTIQKNIIEEQTLQRKD